MLTPPLPLFQLEEFWKKYEFSTPYLLCPSDMESWSLKEILALADPQTQELWEHLRLGYTEVSGLPLLRAEIASLYNCLDENHILTTAGAEEAIYCSLRTLVNPGDHVVVVAPCYQSLLSIPQTIGAEVTIVELQAAKNWQLDCEELESVLRVDTKLIVLNYPHNPTGALLSREAFERIIALARARGIFILCDEVYRLSEIDESQRLPAIADAYEKGISLNVMTKTFGLAGLRIGWLASRDKNFMECVSSYKLYTSICNSAPSEIIALIALRAKEKIVARNREIMLSNLALLDQFMERYQSLLHWIRPQSGPMAFIELCLPLSIDEFTEKCVQNSGVLIMPCTVFNFPGKFFRIGFGRKNMPKVLGHFERFIQSNL